MALILVVDDDLGLRHLVRTVLEVEGHAVQEAGDADEALAALRAHRPAVAIIDVELDRGPRRGAGLSLTRGVKADPSLAGTRIILCTGAAATAQRKAGLAAGADRYVTKPFSPLSLLRMVRDLLPAAGVTPDIVAGHVSA